MEPDAGKVFDAAKAIVKTLQSMDKTQQQQALRFASASLALGLPTTPSAPAVTPPLPAANPVPSPVMSAQSADIKQFTMAKKPKSDQQFAAVVAYYYRFEAPAPDRKDAIGSDDLTQAAEAIDAAISEVKTARSLVQKVKAKQVRSVDVVATLKSTAYAWFNSHRPTVTVGVLPLILQGSTVATQPYWS